MSKEVSFKKFSMTKNMIKQARKLSKGKILGCYCTWDDKRNKLIQVYLETERGTEPYKWKHGNWHFWTRPPMDQISLKHPSLW